MTTRVRFVTIILSTILTLNVSSSIAQSVTPSIGGDGGGLDSEVSFLYHYMPLCDSVDYSRSYWENQVKLSLQAREEMSWGKNVPDREFRHFVLPVRVNNEVLDESRQVFFEALRRRVNGMSMKEAALEVNHWCHEHVSYRPSDGRTSPPLATMKNTIGRCGEESTFTVAALRSVCIPARQVYVPRWAHTDDNHAWVEVWCDGKWYFMGACEPEAELDKGWFNWAASRAMLVHTNAFGNYDGPEEFLRQDKCYTEVNCLKTYAPTKQLTVTVADKQGKPIPDAMVDFRLFNYSEFYPLLSRKTDKNGKVSLTTGYGDLLVWVAVDEHVYDYRKVDAKETEVTITPEGHVGMEWSKDLDFHAPISALKEPDRSFVDTVSQNGRRLVAEDEIRTAYQKKTFWTKEKAVAQMAELGIDTVEWEIFTKARSNASTLRTFLEQAGDKKVSVALLKSLSEKDLRDVTLDVLWDSYNLTPNNKSLGMDMEEWTRNVLCPRISTEPLRPYKAFLSSVLPKMNASEWVKWVEKNISIDDSRNPNLIPMSAVGVYNNKVTDSRSRNLFMVAGARALGIPAYLDPATGSPVVGGSVLNPRGEAGSGEGSSDYGTLRIDVDDDILYYQRYSIARIIDGRPVSLEYPDDDPSVTKNLKKGVQLPHGNYMITSGTRIKGGDILVHMEMIWLEPGEKRTVPVILRASEHSVHSDLELDDSEKNASATSVQSAQ